MPRLLAHGQISPEGSPVPAVDDKEVEISPSVSGLLKHAVHHVEYYGLGLGAGSLHRSTTRGNIIRRDAV